MDDDLVDSLDAMMDRMSPYQFGQPDPPFDGPFMDRHRLFSIQDFASVLQGRTEEMRNEIRKYPANELLNTGTERLLDYFYKKYSIDLPRLDQDNRSVTHSEVAPAYSGASLEHSKGSRGFKYVIRLPFSGEPRIFNSCPTINSAAEPPLATIRSVELVFTYFQAEVDGDQLKSSHDRDLASVKQYLGWLAAETDGFNSRIRSYCIEQINERRTQLLKAQGAAASLGIRLERANLPRTYPAPQVQRRPRITRPRASQRPYAPEPALEMAEYEYILNVIRGTTLVIERNPSTFAVATEPMIRDHFLVQLNGHYEGQATGETFNSHGKTDILVRSGNKNIFVAEIKFWDGAKSLTNALRQLLTRYTTWRDSKIALIVLNRRLNFSAVLDQISVAVQAYEGTMRELSVPGATNFRYLLQHPDDPDKELLLTVMCFEVPGKRSEHTEAYSGHPVEVQANHR